MLGRCEVAAVVASAQLLLPSCTGLLKRRARSTLNNSGTAGASGQGGEEVIPLSIDWQYLGQPLFAHGMYLSMAVDPVSHNPFMAFNDMDRGGKLSVMKWQEGSWVYLGTPAFTPSSVNGVKIEFEPTTGFRGSCSTTIRRAASPQ